MPITRRQATHQEILDAHRSRVTGDFRRVLYRHFTREIYNPRARNGVSHRVFSRARLMDIAGVPHVTYHGQPHPVRAIHHTLPDGRTFIAGICLDSEYLPIAA